ncbi:serpin family protein [Methanococcoides burtonii]|uniref:Serine protease inhibitor n=1 Tax=Methanococcoides burtonii (strain DSM 6242 / NBRC 107633 / OCM 468 / ACE-M) TaxID=259564 RepID=Q12V94_METBU|nr:serpin family protein [Methanococcoides burtonii]ABE52632.1 serine protease inhibitor [Methanococcoides burtonii DSM 6242]
MNVKNIICTVVICVLLFSCIGCIGTGTNSDSELDPTSTELEIGNISSPSINVESETVDKSSMMYAYSPGDYDIATANNAFSFDMYNNLATDGNIVFSPYSIFTAMAICYNGAESTTQEEIAYVFYYPLSKPVLEKSSKEMMNIINSDDDNNDLKTANALWVRENYPLNERFVGNSKIYYDGKVTNVDFRNEPERSRDIINEWVATKTNEKIKDLVPDDMVTSDTAMIITNAIYFKGKWLNEFDVEETQKELFYNSSSNEEGTPIDMMYTKQYFSYGENKDAKIVELPYKGDDLCMYIVLPEENNIENFESRFRLSDYNNLKSSMESGNEVRIWLPKFKFDTKAKLSDTLKTMGLVEAFTGNADFSGIFDIQKVPEDYALWLHDVVHQAFIDVQEEGTEATAATAIEAVDSCLPLPGEVMEFKVDHPFMFFIEDKRTGCILFMGKVENPLY